MDERFMATRDEMSFPDWARRLRRAKKESRLGQAVSLDTYLKLRTRLERSSSGPRRIDDRR
jgi:hypothetical protein